MRPIDEQTEAPGYSTSGLIAHAGALNLVLVSSLFASGMLFAVDFEIVTIVALGLSILIWGSVALVLIPVWLSSLVGQLREGPMADSLHDSWLDD
jgi:hypothetical protein